MGPSPADFASIVELMEVKKLYDEQEERWKQRMQEKDEQIAQLEKHLAGLKQEIASSGCPQPTCATSSRRCASRGTAGTRCGGPRRGPQPTHP